MVGPDGVPLDDIPGSSGIHQAYSNAWFATRLTVLTDQWHVLNPAEWVSVKQQRLFDT